MFSLVRFKIDATGTALEGKTLESVTMTVTRDGAAVPVTGDFTFSAVDGTYTEGTTSNELKTVWNQTLDGELSSFATVFPEVQSGDKLTFLAVCGKDAVKAGVKAGDIVKNVCTCCGGSGGGKPDSAMGGGKDASKLPEALNSVADFVASKF